MRILDLGGLGLRCGARRPPSQWVDWRWTAAIHPDLFAHRPIFVCFVSVKTFSVAFEALICSLLFSNCSATSGLIFQLSRQRFSKGSRLRPCSSDSITYDGTRFRALDLLFGNTCSPCSPILLDLCKCPDVSRNNRNQTSRARFKNPHSNPRYSVFSKKFTCWPEYEPRARARKFPEKS